MIKKVIFTLQEKPVLTEHKQYLSKESVVNVNDELFLDVEYICDDKADEVLSKSVKNQIILRLLRDTAKIYKKNNIPKSEYINRLCNYLIINMNKIAHEEFGAGR